MPAPKDCQCLNTSNGTEYSVPPNRVSSASGAEYIGQAHWPSTTPRFPKSVSSPWVSRLQCGIRNCWDTVRIRKVRASGQTTQHEPSQYRDPQWLQYHECQGMPGPWHS